MFTRVLRTTGIAILLVGTVLAPTAGAQTTSPFAPPTEQLGVYVINSGSGLDTGCTYRSGGPLVIRFELPAVVNTTKLNPDGTLRDAAALQTRGVIGRQATLRFPVFDIDSSAVTSGFSPEVDRLSFNGVYKRNLSGANNTWTDDSLTVDVSELRFKSSVSPSAINELRIDIDQANIGNGEFWCMAVDWVATSFDVAAPYVLLHGTAANLDTWNADNSPGLLQALEQSGVLFTRFNALPNGSSAANGSLFRQQIESFLAPLKSKAVHLVAHSKGGLDAQELQASGPPFVILSLSTLSTPHLGTPIADATLIQLQYADRLVEQGADPNGHVRAYLTSTRIRWGAVIGTVFGTPDVPALWDNATYNATSATTLGRRANVAKMFTIGASADLNGNGSLESNESAGLYPGLLHFAAEAAWEMIGDVSSIPFTARWEFSLFGGLQRVLYYNSQARTAEAANDITVAVSSAHPGWGNETSLGTVNRNHGTVKNAATINLVLTQTIPMRCGARCQ